MTHRTENDQKVLISPLSGGRSEGGLLTPAALSEITAPRLVGFYGVPPRSILHERARALEAPLLDLDVALGAPPAGVLPEAYCRVAATVMDNALALRSRLVEVVAAVGPEKCDAGRYTAAILKTIGIPVLETTNAEGIDPPDPILLCDARGPVKKRVVRIMRGVALPLSDEEASLWSARRCEPSIGFWGTPPEPIDLLDLLPEDTHLFGWTRAVEAGRPADLAIEMHVPPGLPIIFFNQGFCPKSQLARHLADTHSGLHVDVHDQLTQATVAKIEAFVKLTVPASRRRA